MTKYILSLILVMGSVSVVKAEEMPSYLKDATITVTLKNGKKYEFSANTHKVVTREDKLPAPVGLKVTQMPAEEKSKVSVILHAGIGMDGLKTTTNNNLITVRENVKPVVGATLCTETSKKLDACISTFSNSLTAVGIKLKY
jgi:hypothetical protein